MTKYTTIEIQRRLKLLGFNPGSLDGIPGRNTQAAIKLFQKANPPLSVDGIIGPKSLAKLFPSQSGTVSAEPNRSIDPPWLILARQKMGLHEVRNNKTLRDWLKSDGNTLGDPAVLPWCGDFMETCIAITLPDEPMIVNPYWALNWCKFGIAAPKGIVPLGAIAPFKRTGGGHIAIIVGHDSTYYYCLGGNQSNAVSIVKIAKSSQEGSLRWPSTYPIPQASDNMPHTSLNATVATNESMQ